MDVNETLLPGVGVRYEFHSIDGDLIGVVAHRNGEFQIVVYDADDPDQCRAAFRLGPRRSRRFSVPRASPSDSLI